jgi:RNA polymerase sigma-70 factor (ECF subfamily)
VAEVDGPGAALALVDALPLSAYPLFHAIRADLLRRLGRHPEAAEAYTRAIEGTANEAQRTFLQGRRDALPG